MRRERGYAAVLSVSVVFYVRNGEVLGEKWRRGKGLKKPSCYLYRRRNVNTEVGGFFFIYCQSLCYQFIECIC